MFVVTAEEMRALDRRTIEEVGIPGPVLMENAGRGAICVLRQVFPDLETKKMVVISGRGNNGGDGFVIARHLYQLGAQVDTCLVGKQTDLSGEARTYWDVLRRLRLPTRELSTGEEDIPWSSYDVIIDALLGTGLHSEVRAPYRDLIGSMNKSGVPIVAVDMPSGLSSDRGMPLGVAVQASVTVTFGLPKLGQFLYPGRGLCGDLYVVDIGLPAQVVRDAALSMRAISPEELKDALPKRARDAHKGHFGHLLVLAGSAGKTGAGIMTSEAALRSGAGLVTQGLPRSLNPAMEARMTEVMTLPLPETPLQSISSRAREEILRAVEGKTCIALGPGLSMVKETQELIREMIVKISAPMVIDADGLNALCGHLNMLKEAGAPRILTPHPGEMSRLLGCSVSDVQKDRVGSASALAGKTNCSVVLKGAGTVVASPNGEIALVPTGNPAMASAGMGDILTGMIGGLTAQGMEPCEASKLGAFLHGWIADELTVEMGERGLVATDLLAGIPVYLNRAIRGDLERTWPVKSKWCPFHV